MSYRIHQFATLAGVSVKALHHYDRLGLLKPRRTPAGYRVYTDGDLERLEQIVALKFIGLPLKEIRALLRCEAPVAQALRAQRVALEEKQRQIARAIDAIAAAERGLGDSAATAPVLQRLIGAITMEQNADILKPYFGDAAWAAWKSRRGAVAASEWEAVYRDIEAVRDEPFTSPRAQEVAKRWLALVETEIGGEPSIRTGLIKAWMDGHRLPTVLNKSADPEAIARASKFVSDVLWAGRDAELRADPHAVPHRAAESRLALFRETETLIDSDPAAPAAQAIVRRWNEVVAQDAEGDPEALRAMQTAWENRARWPAGMRRYMASLYDATPETWERVAAFIDRARACQAAEATENTETTVPGDHEGRRSSQTK